MISLLTGILLSEKGGEFSQGGKWPIDCLYGGTYISPFWAPLMTIYIYTFFPFKEEGRRRDFTSVRSSKHRPSSSSRSRRRTKDDWAGRRAGCSLRLRVLLLSRNFLTREENFNNFSHSLFFSLEQKNVWWITFHNCVLDCSGNFRNDGSILSFVETYYSI